MVCQNIRNGWLGLFVLLGCIMYIGKANQVDVQTWGIMAVFIAAGHGLLVHTFLRRDKVDKIISYLNWGRAVALYSLLAGMTVSIGACLVFSENSIGWAYLLVALMVMPGFGSAVTSTSFLPVHICWVIGAIFPLGLYLSSQMEETFFAIGMLMIFTALPMMLLLGVGYARMYHRNIALQLKNIDLVQALQVKVDNAMQSNVDKSRFLAAVSHDLRQPLHALDLFHASLKHRLEDQEQQNLLEMASHSSHVLGGMLGELMDIARIDAGKITPDIRGVPLIPLLRECADEMRPLAKEKGLALRLRLPRQACVNTDPVLLKHILRNLLSNAICYTQKGGVLLGTRMRNDWMHIEVRDTGTGIDRQQLPHIFDEFYQINNSERDRNKGLGLGLSIVQHMAKLLGHRIKVRSTPGKGSCFSIAAPICLMTDQCDQEEFYEPEIDDGDLVGMFVLVIDDDFAILQGMRALLLSWGCEVLVVESEEELMRELSAHHYQPPDLVISDYRLRSEHTGLEVIKTLRKHFDSQLPAAIISGDMHPAIQAEVTLEACQWLEKPVSEKNLRRLLADIAEKSLT